MTYILEENEIKSGKCDEFKQTNFYFIIMYGGNLERGR